ncbi:MAG: cysteine--tRNA ligase, partial [Chitinophagaceae bacterium]|nr:cysteine--tRNA ligase [Chitinophagaceae bacterium]MCF8422294.1 cysteine--tRNA ligase [Chitinophagaceae bacterium]
MPLKIYNSLTRQKEVFEPINAPYVGMYVCGPTVSGESHLGHARPFITFDVVYRYLLHKGYKVRYVRNITDAGHFEEEGKVAEDKIASKAILEKLEPMELVQKYTNLYHWAMTQFNNLPPSIEPTATGHIVEQIEMIKKIMADGYAYESNGSVYFDVVKYNDDYSKKNQPYGILSGRNIEEQLETTRDLENQEEKKNKVDFALWKKAPAEHIMRWQSPWGEGFPGWHIECSAMATKYLGKQFDIHGGGMDLQFPHHECEIAQSTVCNHQMPARYWMHNNMITINGRKMGKSYNNVIKLSELFEGNHAELTQAYTPMTVRFFILQSQYRGTLDFSNEALQASEKALRRFMEGYEWLQAQSFGNETVSKDQVLADQLMTWTNELELFMDDDMNTAKVVANLFEILPSINSLKDKHIAADAVAGATWATVQTQLKLFVESILGIKVDKGANRQQLNGVVELLIEIRK